jgi:hypothetical protein
VWRRQRGSHDSRRQQQFEKREAALLREEFKLITFLAPRMAERGSSFPQCDVMSVQFEKREAALLREEFKLITFLAPRMAERGSSFPQCDVMSVPLTLWRIFLELQLRGHSS